MSDTRRKNTNWKIKVDPGGVATFDQAKLAVLMDIRDELQALNRIMSCSNTLAIPALLRSIGANTEKTASNTTKTRRKVSS